MNKDNTQEFIRWLLEASDTARLQEFLQLPSVLSLAQEFFKGDWEMECELHPDEPEFPYNTAVYSLPQVYFEDVEGNETDDYMDLNAGTLVEVIRKSAMFPDMRLCRIANGDPDQYFWLTIEELQYNAE